MNKQVSSTITAIMIKNGLFKSDIIDSANLRICAVTRKIRQLEPDEIDDAIIDSHNNRKKTP